MHRLLRLFLLITLVLLCVRIHAVFPSDPQQKRIPDSEKQLIEQSGGVEQYPDADILTIFDRTEVNYQENGDYTIRQASLLKILTENGKKKYATIDISYHKRYEEVTIDLARVIYPDGSCIDIPPDSIKDGTEPSLQEMNIYEENFRQKSITVPDLTVGCCIEYSVTTKTKALLKDNFAYVTGFQSTDPVLECSVTITGPASKPLKYVVKNGEVTFSKKQENDRITYRWEARKIPQIITEAGMVPAGDVAIKLVVSTFSSWKELSRYGDSLNEGKTKPNEQLQETVRKLTANLTTDREKILAIHRFVSQKIRYMGSSMDVGAFIEPHEATYTLEKQYGVCRDKSVLMMTMLKEIGIDCYDVLINVTSETVEEVPTVYFQHAIAGVVLKDGTIVFMDPTLELSDSFGETYVGDKHVLLLSKEGKDLIRAPHVPAEKSMGAIEAETALDREGNLSGKITVSGIGYYDFVLRSYNQSYTAVQFERFLGRLASEFHPKTEVRDVKTGNPTDLAAPYSFSFAFETSDYSIPAGNFLLFHLPLSSCSFDIAVGGIFSSYTKLKERKYPLGLFSTRGCLQNDTITIPEGYRVVSVPPDLTVKEGPVSLVTKTEVKDRKISYRLDYRIEKSRLTPEEYQDLRKVALQLKHYAKYFVVLEK